MEITVRKDTLQKMFKLVGITIIVLTGIFIAVQSSDSENVRPRFCVPAFADGGGPYYLPNQPFRTKLSPEDTQGQKLIVSGRLFASDCETLISDAVIDIWQADETGHYIDDWYRGQIRTDAQGRYEFETIIPRGYGEGTGYRPPHIHFMVFIDGIEVARSQMFFPDVTGQPGFNEAFIMEITERNEGGQVITYGRHDIVLDR